MGAAERIRYMIPISREPENLLRLLSLQNDAESLHPAMDGSRALTGGKSILMNTRRWTVWLIQRLF